MTVFLDYFLFEIGKDEFELRKRDIIMNYGYRLFTLLYRSCVIECSY